MGVMHFKNIGIKTLINKNNRIMKKIFAILTLTAFTVFSYGQTVIKMEKKDGVYFVPCTVNGLKLKFIFDTGANDVSISLSEALFMLKNDYLDETDFNGVEYYRIANGDVEEGTKIILKKLELGDKTLYNVEASIVHSISAPLLLGQSALEKFGKFSVDYSANTLTLGTESNNNDSLKAETIRKAEQERTAKEETARKAEQVRIAKEETEKKAEQERTAKSETEKYHDNCIYPSPIPNDITITVNKCNQLYLECKFEECILNYNALCVKYPDYCVAFYNRGLAKFHNGDKIGAKLDFEKALSLGLLDTKKLLIKYYGQ